MIKYIAQIENIWQKRLELRKGSEEYLAAKKLIKIIIDDLDKGKIRVVDKNSGNWEVHEWVKKSILLNFYLFDNQVITMGAIDWYDKIPPKFNNNMDEEQFDKLKVRCVPGAFIRKGAYLAPSTVIMPSFINIGAYIGEGTMIDSWATIGSCAQIGKNCHISEGVCIGGTLEPLSNTPVIIEDNCFIGARSGITEGVIIEEGCVIAMGVFLGSSTKIVYRETGEIIMGRVPRGSVVVPGVLPSKNPMLPSLTCAVIVKQVDSQTRSKTMINEILREID